MIHITCLIQELHRISEKIRLISPKANKLISNVKKVFVKANDRESTFNQLAADIPLPIQPVITRWGTWIEAANYYAINFETLKNVIELFDKEDACAHEVSQKLFNYFFYYSFH